MKGERETMLRITRIVILLVAITLTGKLALGQANANGAANENPSDRIATQVGLLRQSVRSLDSTLGDIADKFLPLFTKAKEVEAATENERTISARLALLTQAEQRAEMLRRQLLELIEKETAYRSKITQIDEDMRPDSIERSLNPYGSTRTAEMRDQRRRILENDRRGYDSLLNVTMQSRVRLEDDVRQADLLVTRLRQRLLPTIDRAIEKIDPDKP
jgi:hypothetical protein